MKYLTSAALALVLMGGAAAASADPSDNSTDNHSHDHGGATQGSHNNSGNPQGGNHTGGAGGGNGGNPGGTPHVTASPPPPPPPPPPIHSGSATTTTTTGGGVGNSQHPMTFPNHPGTGHTNSPPPPPPPPVHSATTQTFTGPANNPNGPHTFTGHNNTGGNSQNGPNGQNNNNRNIPGFNNNGRFQPINPGFGHSLRPRDNGRHAYNPSLFPRIFQTARRFHIAPYVQPRGWFFRSWAYGDFLPQGWFDAPYYLDWGYYRLPMPPIGCEWVREGNDALLVDVWTGEILSIEPNMFW